MAHKDPEKSRAYSRAYGASHREERKAYNAAHVGDISAYHRAYHAAHREERLARGRADAVAHREERVVANRAYRKANPEKVRAVRAASAANKAAKKAGVPGRITAAIVRAVWEAPSCAYCGSDGIGLDHVIPLSRGGPNTSENIVRCCLSCNSSKQDRTPEEWRAQG